MTDCITILLGLLAGASTAVAASCVWGVLLLPARVQDRRQGAASCSLTWAICSGMVFSAAGNALGFSLPLPAWAGAAGLLAGGMFVGMLASALGEILEVGPVLMRRFRLGSNSAGFRWVMMIGKGLGAVIAALAFTK